MRGPEHYREAERDIERASDAAIGDWSAFMLARAQVHATLALTAAVVDQTGARGPGDVPQDWLTAVMG